MGDSLTSMGRAVCDHLWQSTALLGVVALLALLLRKNQARARYWLWMAASAKFLIPISMLVALGSHLPLRRHTPAATPANTYIAIDQMSQPFADQVVFDPPMYAPAAQTESRQPVWPMAIAGVWLFGLIGMTGYWCVQWRRVVRAVRRARPMVEGREVEILRRLTVQGARFEGEAKTTTKTNAGILPAPASELAGDPVRCAQNDSSVGGAIEVRVSAEQMEPGVVGLLRPVLLWPEGISQHLDDAHLERILAHEVCHVARRDNLTALLHMVVETVFWFHPLVWWMERQLVKERERACDEWVLERCGAPGVYAQSILKVCEYCVEAPLVCVSGITGADLKRRVVQIMTGGTARRLTWPKKLLLAGVAFAAVAAPIVVGLNSPLRALAADTDWEKVAGGVQRFEVASVRENKLGGNSDANFTLDGNGNAYFVVGKDDKTAPEGNLFRATNQTLMRYIIFAYRLSGTEELALRMNFWAGADVKAPEWVNATHYDIEARTPGPATKDQMRLMMQGLLKERFKLAAHTETRQVPVFAMVMEKAGTLGPQLRAHPASDTCATTVIPDRAGAGVDRGGTTTAVTRPAAGVSGILPMPCGMIARLPASAEGRHRIGGRSVTMAMIAASLPGQTGLATFPRPVIDGTGLGGTFDFTLEWAPPAPIEGGQMAPGPKAQGDVPGPSIAKALQEQLGINLESTRGPVELLVIDHVERPAAQDADAGTGSAMANPPVPASQAPVMKPAMQAQTEQVSFVKQFSRFATFASAFVAPAEMAQGPAASPGREAVQDGTSHPTRVPMDAVPAKIDFDVVLFKRCAPGVVGTTKVDMPMTSDYLSYHCEPMSRIIYFAYNGVVSTYSLESGYPKWVDDDRYDFTVKVAPEDIPAWQKLTVPDRRVLIRKVLADAVGLKIRIGTTPKPIYALTVMKKVKMTVYKPGDQTKLPDGRVQDGTSHLWTDTTSYYQGFTMALLAEIYSVRMDRVVADRTNLTETYNFVTPVWGGRNMEPDSRIGPGEDAPTINDTLERLGLQLKPENGAVERLVIDHIERPTAN